MSRIPNDWDNIEEKLQSRTIIDPITNCWLWQGSKTADGYGNIGFLHKVHRIHRISACLYLNFNINEKELQVLHKIRCSNRHCWNPEHLYIGTNDDNVRDTQVVGTNFQHTRTHCPHGHLLDGIKSTGWRYCKTCNNIRNRAIKIKVLEGEERE